MRKVRKWLEWLSEQFSVEFKTVSKRLDHLSSLHQLGNANTRLVLDALTRIEERLERLEAQHRPPVDSEMSDMGLSQTKGSE